MKTVTCADLARTLGISRYTVRDWCQTIPNFAYKRGRQWVIRLSAVATLPGFDYVRALTHTKKRWIKAVDLAASAGYSRRTMSHWCKTRPNMAIRIGRIWYVCPEDLGGTDEQRERLEQR